LVGAKDRIKNIISRNKNEIPKRGIHNNPIDELDPRLDPISDTAEEIELGYVSGFKEIWEKAKLARAGNIGAKGEIEAAKALRASGKNVHFQTPVGNRSPAGNTADFLVGGQKGTGIGGSPVDVLTPIAGKRDSIIKGIVSKSTQTPNVFVNLRHATPSIKASEIGTPTSVLNEIKNGFINSDPTVINLRSIQFLE
jgi:hypothetical protein